MEELDKKNIIFTHHALARARERKLWKYVSKEKFYYDAIPCGLNEVKLGDCVYAYKNKGRVTIIKTMYKTP